MVRIMILGLPRTATTFVYNEVCRYLKRLGSITCIFEPFNYEVMHNIVKTGRHFHDKAGEVIHDYNKLPKDIVMLIYENSKWLVDWIENEKPTTPFLGSNWMKIVKTFNILFGNVVVKDVCLWVYLDQVVKALPGFHFILTRIDFETYYRKMLKRFHMIRNPLDKGGVGKFYRFFNSLQYFRDVNEETFYQELKIIHRRYEELLSSVKTRENVHVIDYRDNMDRTLIINLLKEVLGW